MIYSAMSLAVTPGFRLPETSISMDLDFLAVMHWVAMVCSTSLVPMPCASAPNAPWVLVCESPQTTVMPGSVAPCSGPITCTMPWPLSLNGKYASAPNSLMFLSKVSTCSLEIGSLMPSSQWSVGVLWSAVETTLSMRHSLRPAIFKPSNACGLVTSCTRWRSIYSSTVPSSSSRTMWLFQSLS